jgi:hypothetical protein
MLGRVCGIFGCLILMVRLFDNSGVAALCCVMGQVLICRSVKVFGTRKRGKGNKDKDYG